MTDIHDADSPDESEFGLGLGLIDPVTRAGRSGMPLHQELSEIYSRPKTFNEGLTERPNLEDTPVPRLLPGEEEADR